MKRHSFPGPATFCVACLVVTATLAAAGEDVEFVPDAGFEGAMPLKGDTWEESGPGYVVRLQQIDEAERRAYLARFTGSATDPFASPPDRPPGFLTFLLQIENHGDGRLIFESQNCWLVTNKKEHLYPIGMEGLRAAYAMVGGEMSPSYEKARSAVLENSVTLLPDRSVAGLLVYRAVKPKTRRYRLDLQLTSSMGDVLRFHAPYRRLKEKEKNQP